MKFYLAPLEGITGFIYRNTYAEVFNNIDEYFAPFVVPNESKSLKTKEFFDILPENNKNINLIPQILTNKAEGFILTMRKMKQLGYKEINLNLGCPSTTVVNKNRGSGFLSVPDELDVFLDKIYDSAVKDDMKVSIKTRLGKDNPNEFIRLLEIYNKYPLEELIIHPRTQKDFYGPNIYRNMFEYALKHSKHNLSYNGNIFTYQDYLSIKELFNNYDNINSFMLGRGIIANPGLLYEIQNHKTVPKDKVKEFHHKLLEKHLAIYTNERGILFKMKEIWSYMIHIFSNSKEYNIAIRKSQNVDEYKQIVDRLFKEEDIIPGAGLFNK